MTDFDEIGVVVDRLDACRKRDLDALLDLYAADATLVCACDDGQVHRGRAALRLYWAERLDAFSQTAAGIEDIAPAPGGVLLDYTSVDGSSIRMFFSFRADGKIQHTRCEPVDLGEGGCAKARWH